MNIPLASQSTFRWMLLPETLSFYAHEREGGNIVLKKQPPLFHCVLGLGWGEILNQCW